MPKFHPRSGQQWRLWWWETYPISWRHSGNKGSSGWELGQKKDSTREDTTGWYMQLSVHTFMHPCIDSTQTDTYKPTLLTSIHSCIPAHSLIIRGVSRANQPKSRNYHFTGTSPSLILLSIKSWQSAVSTASPQCALPPTAGKGTLSECCWWRSAALIQRSWVYVFRYM